MTDVNTDVEEFDLSKIDTSMGHDRRPITIWVRPETKDKYDMIQKLSCKKFAKHLRGLVTRSIEKVKVDEAG